MKSSPPQQHAVVEVWTADFLVFGQALYHHCQCASHKVRAKVELLVMLSHCTEVWTSHKSFYRHFQAKFFICLLRLSLLWTGAVIKFKSFKIWKIMPVTHFWKADLYQKLYKIFLVLVTVTLNYFLQKNYAFIDLFLHISQTTLIYFSTDRITYFSKQFIKTIVCHPFSQIYL